MHEKSDRGRCKTLKSCGCWSGGDTVMQMLRSPVSVGPKEPIEEPPSAPAEENLEGLLEEGLRTLLLEATRISVLEAPYGEPDLSRFLNPFPPEPPVEDPPLPVIEDEGDDEEDDEDDEDDEDEEEPLFTPPPFKFEYGFNALAFLGKYLHKYHPRNIAKRNAERKANFAYLCRRAEHGKRQMSNAIKLRGLLHDFSSGILLGPLCGSVTADSAVLWARALKPGRLVFQYSDDPDFPSPEQARVDVTADSDLTARVQIENLSPGRRYYCRACIVNPGLGYPAPPHAQFRGAKFSTMPEFPTPDYALRFSFASMALLPDALSSLKPRMPDNLLDQIDAKALNFFLFLGSYLPQGPAHANMSLTDLRVWYRKTFYSSSRLLDPFKHMPFMAAFNDPSEGSAEALKQEEDSAQAQLAKDSAASAAADKKASKTMTSKDKKAVKIKEKKEDSVVGTPKAQTLQPLRPAVQAFGEYFPTRNTEIRGQTYWRTKMCGDVMELFVMDLRNGKLGQRQANWIVESMQSSTATWKVLASPASAAYMRVAKLPHGVGDTSSRGQEGGDPPSSSRLRLSQRSHRSNNSSVAATTLHTDRSGASDMSASKSPSRHRRKKSGGSVSSAGANSEGKEEDRVVTLAKLVQRLQHQSVKNVLLLCGELPYPYALTLAPEHSDAELKNVTYYEFGAGSLVDATEDPEARRLVQKAYAKNEETFVLKDQIPLMIGNYHGIVTVSKSGRIKYNVYANKDGSKKQWVEIKPVK